MHKPCFPKALSETQIEHVKEPLTEPSKEPYKDPFNGAL